MKTPISALIITKNSQDTLEESLKSLVGLVDEIVVVDGESTDNTIKIAKKYKAKIISFEPHNFGKQRAYGLLKVKNDWVLALDSDEVVSENLKSEIKNLKINFDAYYIPFQTFFLGHPLRYGGERYKKLVFFRKNSVFIKPLLIHEKFEIKKGPAGTLKGKIFHFSYRSLSQIFSKFTDYAIKMSREKIQKSEKSSLKKIFIYPLHMFYARFIKDKGYKDGLFRIPLDLGFAYMEFLTYLLLTIPPRRWAGGLTARAKSI